MKKMPSTLRNMVLSLTLISLIGVACLSAVFEVTKEPIAKSKLEKQIAALKVVLPDFDNDIISTKNTVVIDGGEIDVYQAYKGEELVGTAVNTFSKNGFGGEIRLMVGLLPDGTIKDIQVLQHSETPGLGDKMDIRKSNFSVQFRGVNTSEFKFKVKKDGGDVDAITAATISSRAFCDALTRAVNSINN
jgi:electron transport complex protein RnfG